MEGKKVFYNTLAESLAVLSIFFAVFVNANQFASANHYDSLKLVSLIAFLITAVACLFTTYKERYLLAGVWLLISLICLIKAYYNLFS